MKPPLTTYFDNVSYPTRTFSIHETQGTLDNLNIIYVGDLKYARTVHSLTQVLAKFNNIRFFFIAPEILAMPDYICEELEEAGIQFSMHSNIEEVTSELDVLYMTRIQKERSDESECTHQIGIYLILTTNKLKTVFMFMHRKQPSIKLKNIK